MAEQDDDTKQTYIQVSKTVANKLNELKIIPREAYEDVLRRVLKLPKRSMGQND